MPSITHQLHNDDLCIMTFEGELGPLLVPTWKTLMCKTLDVLYVCSRQKQVEGSSHFAQGFKQCCLHLYCLSVLLENSPFRFCLSPSLYRPLTPSNRYILSPLCHLGICSQTSHILKQNHGRLCNFTFLIPLKQFVRYPQKF